MAQRPPLGDDERDELIAYLDGESALTDSQAVEKKLNTDPRFRAEADALRKTWNLLDYMPRPEPSPSFTQKTLTRVTAAQVRAPAKRFRRWAVGLGWAAGILIAAGAGYWWLPGVLKLGGPDPSIEIEARMARDLRVLEQLNTLQHVPDIHFLNELDRPELFGDEQGF